MKLNVWVYNTEWMRNLFDENGEPFTQWEAWDRSKKLADVINAMELDFLWIVEGPDTKKDGTKTATAQLENWVWEFWLNENFKWVHGTPSNGQQELCALYDASKINVSSTPTWDEDKENRFDKHFIVDTLDDLIEERYKHFRPPLELTIQNLEGEEFSKAIVAHTKSKWIFSKVDYARFEQISKRDRMRLYAECMSIRLKCDYYLNQWSEIMVMWDINDGAGMDFYENRFSKSAMEVLLWDVWEPNKIMSPVLEKPKWWQHGWTPSSSSYTDRITEDKLYVLIDHMLVSQWLSSNNGMVWNPYNQSENDTVQSIRNQLADASDHFPVTAEVENKNIAG